MTKPDTHIKRIIIIDDEQAIRQLCHRVLTGEGFEVDDAANGTAAQSKISKQEYDLYLFDIRMPLMDGKELYSSLQKTDPGITSRIIFITGSAIGQDTQSFLQSSGRPVLLKPFGAEELKAIVTQTLKAIENDRR